MDYLFRIERKYRRDYKNDLSNFQLYFFHRICVKKKLVKNYFVLILLFYYYFRFSILLPSVFDFKLTYCNKEYYSEEF